MAAGFLPYIPPECLEPPPAIYDHQPEIAVPVTFVSREQLRAMVDLLGDVPQGYVICGVTVRGGGKVEVFILDGMTVEVTEAVKRHEYGHVNGWQHAS